jgi:hypothetical protein
LIGETCKCIERISACAEFQAESDLHIFTEENCTLKKQLRLYGLKVIPDALLKKINKERRARGLKAYK